MEPLEEMALRLAREIGKLTAIVKWCVENDGECLGDNPKQLAVAKRVLAEAEELLP